MPISCYLYLLAPFEDCLSIVSLKPLITLIYILAINCKKLVQPINSTLSTDKVLFGTVVDIVCDKGHRFNDDDKAKNTECLETERWRKDTFSDCAREYSTHQSRHSYTPVGNIDIN